MRRRLAVAIAALAVGLTSLTSTSSAQTAIYVSPSFFGVHGGYAPGLMRTPPWPTRAWRLQSVGTPWCRLNPGPQQFQWAPVDAWFDHAASRGSDLAYVFSYPPRWAAATGAQAGGCGVSGDPLNTAPPNEQAWRDFVTALVTHSAGRIAYYELWNEANSALFWRGNVAQLVRLSDIAAGIIRSLDPAAKILTPSVTTTGQAWLQDYLSRVSKANVDVVAYHGYTTYTGPESILTVASRVKSAMAATGFGGYPMWNSEGGWGPDSAQSKYADPSFQRGYVARLELLNISSGAQRFYWYRYDGTPGSSWGTLSDYLTGQLTPAGAAMGVVINWLAGATLQGPCARSSTGLWTCDLTTPWGSTGRVLWVTTGTKSYAVPTQFRTQRTLAGTAAPVSPQLTVRTEPVLLDSAPAA